MGCQYAIADKIIAKEGDYIFSLKGNEGMFSEDVDFYFNSKIPAKSLSSCIEYDKGHGCLKPENVLFVMMCSGYGSASPLENHPLHYQNKCYTRVRDSKKTTQEARYYISSLKKPAPNAVLPADRRRWGVENTLHSIWICILIKIIPGYAKKMRLMSWLLLGTSR